MGMPGLSVRNIWVFLLCAGFCENLYLQLANARAFHIVPEADCTQRPSVGDLVGDQQPDLT